MGCAGGDTFFCQMQCVVQRRGETGSPAWGGAKADRGAKISRSNLLRSLEEKAERKEQFLPSGGGAKVNMQEPEALNPDDTISTIPGERRACDWKKRTVVLAAGETASNSCGRCDAMIFRLWNPASNTMAYRGKRFRLRPTTHFAASSFHTRRGSTVAALGAVARDFRAGCVQFSRCVSRVVKRGKAGRGDAMPRPATAENNTKNPHEPSGTKTGAVNL